MKTLPLVQGQMAVSLAMKWFGAYVGTAPDVGHVVQHQLLHPHCEPLTLWQAGGKMGGGPPPAAGLLTSAQVASRIFLLECCCIFFFFFQFH